MGYLLTGDPHSAEDLLQAALVKTIGRWTSVSRSGTRVKDLDAYVRKVMYHENISVWRRLRSRGGSPAAERDEGRPDVTWQVDLRVTLRKALLQLTVKQRTIVVMRYFDDLSETQVAQGLGLSVGTVRSQTAKALGRLRDLVPSMDDEWAAKGAM